MGSNHRHRSVLFIVLPAVGSFNHGFHRLNLSAGNIIGPVVLAAPDILGLDDVLCLLLEIRDEIVSKSL